MTVSRRGARRERRDGGFRVRRARDGATVPAPAVVPAARGSLSQTLSIYFKTEKSAVNVVDLTVLNQSGNASAFAGAIVWKGTAQGWCGTRRDTW